MNGASLEENEYGTAKAERCINPSKEVIQPGQLRVHCLVTGDNLAGEALTLKRSTSDSVRIGRSDDECDPDFSPTDLGVRRRLHN